MTSEDEVNRVKRRVHEVTDDFNCRMLTPLTWQLARKDNNIKTDHIPQYIKDIKSYYSDINFTTAEERLVARRLRKSNANHNERKKDHRSKPLGTATDTEEGPVHTKLIFGSN